MKGKLIKEIQKRMDYDKDDSTKIYEALKTITKEHGLNFQEFIMRERWYNLYIDIENYRELGNKLLNEEFIFGDSLEERALLEFIKEEYKEENLKKRLEKEGWIVHGGIAVLIDK